MNRPWRALSQSLQQDLAVVSQVHRREGGGLVATLVSWLHFRVTFSPPGLCFMPGVCGVGGCVQNRGRGVASDVLSLQGTVPSDTSSYCHGAVL